MAILYDLESEATLQRIVENIESGENQTRTQKQLRAYELSNGAQAEKILETLKSRYPESYDGMNIMDVRIAEKILRKLARCYANGATREVYNTDGKTINQPITDLINYIYSDVDDTESDFNNIMQELNTLFINHRYVEQFVYVDDEGKIRFKNMPCHLFTAFPNQSRLKAEVNAWRNELTPLTESSRIFDGTTEFLEYYDIDGCYTVWSKEKHFDFYRLRLRSTVDSQTIKDNQLMEFKYVIPKQEENEENENPYGIMNFVQYKVKTNGHFYPLGPSEISEQGHEICVVLSDLVTIAKEQGFGQAVIYYDSDKPPTIEKTGPTHAIFIKNKDGKSRFDFANARPDLKGHLEIAVSLIRLLLSTNDLSTDKVSAELSVQHFASAIDRLIADSEVITNIEDQRKKYRLGEQKTLNIVLKLIAYLMDTKTYPEDYPKVNRADLDKKYRLVIKFNTIKPITTEKEKAESIDFLEEKGFILPHEKHTRFNEGMNEKQAIERENKIQEAKRKKQELFMKAGVDKANEEIKESENGNRGEIKSKGFQNKGNNRRKF